MVEGALDPSEVASALMLNVGLFVRRLRQSPWTAELTMPEQSTLSRLERGGPASASDLARAEQVTPQAVGPLVAGLEERGLVMRSPDPKDGRRVLLSVTEPGLEALRNKRSARVERMANVLAEDFSPTELETLHAAAQLIERLGEKL
jgi:DNA-binding MarR family transcriptional regulator